MNDQIRNKSLSPLFCKTRAISIKMQIKSPFFISSKQKQGLLEIIFAFFRRKYKEIIQRNEKAVLKWKRQKNPFVIEWKHYAQFIKDIDRHLELKTERYKPKYFHKMFFFFHTLLLNPFQKKFTSIFLFN